MSGVHISKKLVYMADAAADKSIFKALVYILMMIKSVIYSPQRREYNHILHIYGCVCA